MTRTSRLLRPASSLALLALLAVAPASQAQGESQPAAEAQAEVLPGARVEAELRDEYVQGVPMLVPLTISNAGEAPVEVPDLSARPWLVRFDMVLPDGRQVRRSTTAPELDGGKTVLLARQGKRRTLLEVPGAESSPVGRYEMVVQLVQGETVREVARRSIVVAAPRVLDADLGPEGLAGTKVGLQAVWVHEATEGVDLYLHQASSADPSRTEAQRHLAHLPGPVQPWLAAARATDAASPVVAWADGARALRLVRVDPTGVVSSEERVDAPWPKVEIVGRPAIQPNGAVLVPLWVPAPSGSKGELRVLSLDGRGRPGFPRIARYDARPDGVATTVDAAGGVHFLVRHAGGLDLYGARTGSPQGPEALPLEGRRLWAPGDGGAMVYASFEVLPDSPELPGGLSVLTLQQSDAGLSGRWLDLHGKVLAELPAVAGAPAGVVADVAPAGTGAPGVLVAAGGVLTWVEGGAATRLPGLSSGAVSVVRASDGSAWLRQSTRSEPVRSRKLQAGG